MIPTQPAPLDSRTLFELLLEAGKAINSEVELEKVVQRVTDIATQLTGARFGAFFYNVINASGEAFVLYTISGVSREAFSKFPMPRNTKIFEPTFAARGIVRYDDVTAQPHYAQNPPYHGMPHGHLPVRSYLAAPVVNPFTQEAIGGLFFGHPDVGVFTEEAERLLEGIAAQAAIAVGNARLFGEKKAIEQRLVEQKEQYLSIFNATSDSMIIYDENGTIAEANPSACRIFGYAYEELIGKPAALLFENPDDFRVLKEIALSGRQYAGTNRRIRKDGSIFTAEFKGTDFIFRGKPHVLSMVRDVTDTQEVRAALERSETLSQVITSVSPVALWMTDDEPKTIYINQTWFDWVGERANSDPDYSWINSVVPADLPRARATFKDAFAARRVFSMDFRIQRRNGEERWCSSHGSPYYKPDGSFGGYAGSVTDITERKLTEQRLESRNVLINTITNNTLQALFLMDDRQFCTYMNPAAEAMTGYRIDEVQEKPLHYYIHHTHPDGRHFPIEECAIDRALPTKSQTQGEEVFIDKSGRFFPVAFIASPIIEKGVPKGTVIEVRDMTEEKRVQEELRTQEKKAMALLEEKVRERTVELEKRNYELLQFTSIASHDLKEPVRKISVFSRLLLDRIGGGLDTGNQRYLNNIIGSADRMIRLIDDLLSFSRLSHLRPAFEPVDLNGLVKGILEDLELPIREKSAVLEIAPLPVVDGIPLQLGQMFQNLFSNSLKFAHPDRAPRISLTVVALQAGDELHYRFQYEDNGIGFHPEQAEKIFEVFQRLHTRDRYEGTGVGLAIVKKIVDLHHGSITASGEENIGARFDITLPARQPE
ncbi:PAS domain S-box protein [Flaviaesturariibacter amylovorans]|uniref:histidine kinase n=1 Tax=Flaviaesturariibacter amylovorans TaxID=1084520 RepID=A0ABP8HB50_9BACT